jgi:hypothetical protein
MNRLDRARGAAEIFAQQLELQPAHPRGRERTYAPLRFRPGFGLVERPVADASTDQVVSDRLQFARVVIVFSRLSPPQAAENL